MVQHNQFSRLPTQNLNLHLFIFVKFYNTLKSNNVDLADIQFILFPSSLRDRACTRLQSLPANSVITWDELKLYFSHDISRRVKWHNLGVRYRVLWGESLFDAWENFKDLVRLCLFHGIEKWPSVHTLYNSFLYSTRMALDVVKDRALINNSKDVAYNLIEDMTKKPPHMGKRPRTHYKIP